jgi:hypothetical protein
LLVATCYLPCARGRSKVITSPLSRSRELWPKLGDGDVSKAAYRGGWKPA